MKPGEGLTTIACEFSLADHHFGSNVFNFRVEAEVPTVAGPWDNLENMQYVFADVVELVEMIAPTEDESYVDELPGPTDLGSAEDWKSFIHGIQAVGRRWELEGEFAYYYKGERIDG